MDNFMKICCVTAVHIQPSASRPGHDLRYALDGSKIAKAGFIYPVNFKDSLKKTIEWSLREENKRWITL